LHHEAGVLGSVFTEITRKCSSERMIGYMFSPQSPLGRLLAAPMRPGRLEWIGVRPGRRVAPEAVKTATMTVGVGIEGDRYRTTHDGPRQVTLIAAEDLAAIAAFVGMPSVAPGLLRRNLVTSGLNLHALKDRRFRVGTVVLETSGECAPCSRMEETLGPGGYNAVRGHGGITARVIGSGRRASATRSNGSTEPRAGSDECWTVSEASSFRLDSREPPIRRAVHTA
jgi:MOSC domain-containing protein YiiM